MLMAEAFLETRYKEKAKKIIQLKKLEKKQQWLLKQILVNRDYPIANELQKELNKIERKIKKLEEK